MTIKLKQNSLLAVLIFLITSCTSDSNYSPIDTPTTTTQKVEIDISNFKEQNGGGLRSTGSENVDEATFLGFYFYDSFGKLYKDLIFKDVAMPSSISLELPKGKYTVQAYASNKEIINPVGSYAQVPDITSFLMGSFFDLEIGDQNIQENITLKHLFGRVQLALNGFENIPENVKSVMPLFYKSSVVEIEGEDNRLSPIVAYGYSKYSDKYMLSLMNTYRPLQEDERSAADMRRYAPVLKTRKDYINLNEENMLTFYFPPTENSNLYVNGPTYDLPRLVLYLVGYDTETPPYYCVYLSSEHVIYTKRISSNVLFKAGESIKYTGNLFPSTNDGISISIDSNWDQEVNEEEL